MSVLDIALVLIEFILLRMRRRTSWFYDITKANIKHQSLVRKTYNSLKAIYLTVCYLKEYAKRNNMFLIIARFVNLFELSLNFAFIFLNFIAQNKSFHMNVHVRLKRTEFVITNISLNYYNKEFIHICLTITSKRRLKKYLLFE